MEVVKKQFRALSEDEILANLAEFALKVTPEACRLYRNETQFVVKHKSYPNLDKFLRVLKVIHGSLFNILEKSRKGKQITKECSNAKKLLVDFRDILRDVLYEPKLEDLLALMQTIIRGINILQGLYSSNPLDVLLFILAFSTFLLQSLIQHLENATDEDLDQYNLAFQKVGEKLQKITSSDVFKAAFTTAASAVSAVGLANGGLAALGFSSTGVQASSIAALWMSSSGPIASGSLFAFLQSAGAIGFGAVVTGGIAVVGGILGLAGFGIYKAVSSNKAPVKGDYTRPRAEDFLPIEDSEPIQSPDHNLTLIVQSAK